MASWVRCNSGVAGVLSQSWTPKVCCCWLCIQILQGSKPKRDDDIIAAAAAIILRSPPTFSPLANFFPSDFSIFLETLQTKNVVVDAVHCTKSGAKVPPSDFNRLTTTAIVIRVDKLQSIKTADGEVYICAKTFWQLWIWTDNTGRCTKSFSFDVMARIMRHICRQYQTNSLDQY